MLCRTVRGMQANRKLRRLTDRQHNPCLLVAGEPFLLHFQPVRSHGQHWEGKAPIPGRLRGLRKSCVSLSDDDLGGGNDCPRTNPAPYRLRRRLAPLAPGDIGRRETCRKRVRSSRGQTTCPGACREINDLCTFSPPMRGCRRVLCQLGPRTNSPEPKTRRNDEPILQHHTCIHRHPFQPSVLP